jgi:hypothetical protein
MREQFQRCGVTLNFRDHLDLLKVLKDLATAEVRTLPQQIVYILKKNVVQN